ncbi:hypothetical protein GQ53DRAFT_743383 [Thozetella sp. PMI_491]|nr:hypothetical protein GQ53DRAFT_743383 [Thozetella sp. PMI_491]
MTLPPNEWPTDELPPDELPPDESPLDESSSDESSLGEIPSVELSPDEFPRLKHWVEYGRKGKPSSIRITAEDRNVKPFSKPITSQWDVSVPHSELEKLLNGFAPREMEDKWLICAEGPDTQGDASVRMYRSWTGFPNLELKLKIPLDADGKVKNESAKVVELVWESDENIRRGQTEETAKEVAEGVCEWILGVKLEKAQET